MKNYFFIQYFYYFFQFDYLNYFWETYFKDLLQLFIFYFNRKSSYHLKTLSYSKTQGYQLI